MARGSYTEYNAETPAGAGYNDALTELFLALPVMRGFPDQAGPSLPVRATTCSTRCSAPGTGAAAPCPRR